MICRCTHEDSIHAKKRGGERGECTYCDPKTFKFCKCIGFEENKSQGENEMAKEKKVRAAEPKSEGRKPKLAGLVDSPFKIYITTGGKEYDAQVLSSGIIKIDEKEFTSPSSAGSYMLGKDAKGKPKQVDGWKAFGFNKDGKRVLLDALRGSKSPLKAEPTKPKREKKAAAPRAATKSKSPSKPRAKKANGVPAAEPQEREPQEREPQETSTEAMA